MLTGMQCRKESASLTAAAQHLNQCFRQKLQAKQEKEEQNHREVSNVTEKPVLHHAHPHTNSENVIE